MTPLTFFILQSLLLKFGPLLASLILFFGVTGIEIAPEVQAAFWIALVGLALVGHFRVPRWSGIGLSRNIRARLISPFHAKTLKPGPVFFNTYQT
jgi:hypothetical protein